MENLMILVCGIVTAAVVLVMFGAYSVYGGRPASLCDAQPGQVYNFEYLQPLHGDSKRVLARVLEKPYKFTDTELNHMNRRSSYRKHDKDFKRTNHLVTCQTHDGEIRQFYCERVKNCRKPLFGTVVA